MVALNVNHWLGVVGDFGAYDGSLGIPGPDRRDLCLRPALFLPQMEQSRSLCSRSHWRAHSNTSNGGFLGANNSFAVSGGGGGDLTLDRAGKYALRGQMDFLNFRAAGSNTGAVRLSAGIVFRLGKKSANRQ